MGNYTYTQRRSVDDIYPSGWYQKHQEEIDRKYEWSFCVPEAGDMILTTGTPRLAKMKFDGFGNVNKYPVIVVKADKPQLEYVTDGNLRTPQEGDYVIEDVSYEIQEFKYGDHSRRERIILSKREVK